MKSPRCSARSLRHLAVALLIALSHAGLAHADADAARFAKATADGRRIAATVQASIAASNALLKQAHSVRSNTFFALAALGNWYVYFGWLTPNGAKFKPAYVLASPLDHPELMHGIDARAAPKNVLGYARAVDASRATVARATHNLTVDPVLWPRADGIDVYVLQGSDRPDSLLIGGDYLDHYDAQGHFQSRVQFHAKVMRVPLPDPSQGPVASGSRHVHTLAEEPTATDVAEVLLHPALAPMIVVGRSGALYRVNADGSIERVPMPARSKQPSHHAH